MIKFAAKTGDGKPLLLLGISRENVARLVAGEPVLIKAEMLTALGLPEMAVVLHYGKTERDIVDEIKAHGFAVQEVAAEPDQ